MKTISNGFLSHLEEEVLTLCTCWRVTRQDGTILRFTSLDKDVVVGSETFMSGVGSYAPSAIATSADLSVDNLDVSIVLDNEAITYTDLIAGLYDYASVEIMLVNWADPSQGFVTLRRGVIGEVEVKKHTARAELRGLTQKYQQVIGRVFTRRCLADFGDTKCRLDLNSYQVTGTVSAVTSPTELTLSATPSRPGGLILWTSGANSGLQMEIVSISGGDIILFGKMPSTPQVGDAFTASAGCDKNLATCISYGNVINFQGFPHIPGLDALVQTPNAH